MSIRHYFLFIDTSCEGRQEEEILSSVHSKISFSWSLNGWILHIAPLSELFNITSITIASFFVSLTPSLTINSVLMGHISSVLQFFTVFISFFLYLDTYKFEKIYCNEKYLKEDPWVEYAVFLTDKHWLCDKRRNQRKYLSSGAKLLRQGAETDICIDGKRLLSAIS